jgi:allantoinase
VVVEGGKIVAVTPDIGAAEVEQRDDFGEALIVPGMVDAHVHCLSDGGEGVIAGTSSAAAGGVTTIIEMPFDGAGPINSVDRLKAKIQLVEKEAVIDVALLGTVVPDGGWTEIQGMVDEGAVGFKVSTFNTDSVRFPRSTEPQLRNVMAAIAAANSIVCVHAENDDVIRPLMTLAENATSEDPRVHAAVRPPVAEELGVVQVLATANEAGARAHLCHLSLPRSVRLANWYRDNEGSDISVETCPHYLVFSTEDVVAQGGRLKINPPVRDKEEAEGLWSLLEAGKIDVVASDHAPWTVEKKSHKIMLDNHSGAPGVETIYATVLAEAVRRGPAMLAAAVRAMSSGPADRYALGDRKGRLAPGYDADIAVFDPSQPWLVDERELHSNAGWSPYHGRSIAGRVVRTISRGVDVWDGQNVTAGPGTGNFVRPKR